MLEKISDTFNKILSVFSTFGISDALDIILVAIIIYICVRIIRESRAMQLAKGFIFMVLLPCLIWKRQVLYLKRYFLIF